MASRDKERYYWLKLDKGFFKRHDITIIEDMPNGKDYVLFLLKLMLESVDHEGTLRFSDTIPYNEAMLASVTRTNVDVVRSAMKIFIELGIVEIFDDKTLYLHEVAKLLDSETYAARRKREQREDSTAGDIVPQLSPACPQEKEIEKDIDTEKEKKETKKAAKADAFAELAGDDADLLEALRDFEKMRTKIKHPLSDRAKALLVTKLKTFPMHEWIPILEQSIFHSWQGIFPLEKDSPRSTNKTAESLQDSYRMMREWASEES